VRGVPGAGVHAAHGTFKAREALDFIRAQRDVHHDRRRTAYRRLASALSLDVRGFVLTGRDLSGTNWPQDREPYPFETSRPGVFAAGDVRHGSVKRIAGAVGEGSVAVGSVHRYLTETAPIGRAGPVMTRHV
jgi:NADPH-dependent glutamate synthase beta subunit-like oxidoreductase